MQQLSGMGSVALLLIAAGAVGFINCHVVLCGGELCSVQGRCSSMWNQQNGQRISWPLLTPTKTTTTTTMTERQRQHPSSSELDFTDPCELVRTTCQKWLDDDHSKVVAVNDVTRREPLVILRHDKIRDLANEILHEKQQQQQKKFANDPNVGNDQSSETIESSKDWIEWDEEDWHYTGKHFQGSEDDKKERVALYLLALDAINFCFWPPCNSDVDENHSKDRTNPLEYEHLALALKKIAEMDHHNQNTTTTTTVLSNSSNSSFGLSPENLAEMTENKLLSLLGPYFQSLNNNTNVNDDHAPTNNLYHLPNLSQRVELLREVGTVLLERYNGSATALIESAKGDASLLVELIATSFPGFRDEIFMVNSSHEKNGSTTSTPSEHKHSQQQQQRIVFLKRAQILVGDWNAALKLNLKGMDRLTTFADYRVPQILRHKDVLEYHSTLAGDVDAFIELMPGSVQEMSIRAATVAAVQELVRVLNDKSINISRDGEEGNGGNEGSSLVHSPFTDVTVDWYLWQVGEKMNNEGRMKPFHRVRTHFY
jgi:Potential Queuosine, Q, salvage protein family